MADSSRPPDNDVVDGTDDTEKQSVHEKNETTANHKAEQFRQQMQRFNYAPSMTDMKGRHIHADSPDTNEISPSSCRSSRKRATLADVDSARASSSPPPAKNARQSSRYAPPSKYAHLPPLQDTLEPNLICVFVGTNPGIRTATAGHAYAHPSNLFWKLLHSSGCTDVRLSPAQDVDLPRLYCMGNTNIVERPSRDAAELSKKEMAAGTPILEDKFRQHRPEAVCIVGKGIWEAIWRWRYKREIKKDEFQWGWQHERENMGKLDDWDGARVFVSSSTSGLSASLRPHEKEAIWQPFGEWVKGRRKERFGVEGRLPAT